MRVTPVISACAAALVLSAAIGAAVTPSPVADAAQKGDIAAVRSLLAKKADVNASQPDGATALQWAAYSNNLQLADVLIKAGADVKLANHDGATPMFLAATNGSAAMLDRLLKAGADPNESEPNGETPVMLVSRTGNLDAIKVLIDHKADLNAKEKLRGTTALMWAAEQSHPDAVKLLASSGADVKAQTDSDTRNSRLNLAPTVQQRLNSAQGAGGLQANNRGAGAAGRGGPGRGAGRGAGRGGAAAGEGGPTLNEETASADDFAFFRRTPPKDGGGLTAMIFAAREGCFDCVTELVAAGADVNQQTFYGWTPLLTATQNRHYKIGAWLLDHGADPNLANKGGWNPLYLATDNRNIESGDYPVRRPDMDHLDYIKLLVDHGANVNARICGVQSTPKECKGDTTETRTNFTMQWLYEDGATAFFRAAQSGDVVLMKYLLAHGADPKIASAHGDSALAAASGIGWVEGVTFEWGEKENIEAVQMCLDAGIDVNMADVEGRTALHGAAHKGRTQVIQMLVDHGANLEAHDLGSRDTVNGAMKGLTWIPLDWSRGLVRVGVQSAIAHPEAEKLLVKLMQDRGLPIPPPPTSSICLTKGVKGCQ